MEEGFREKYPECGDKDGIEAAIESDQRTDRGFPDSFFYLLLEPTVVNVDAVKKLFQYDKLCHHLHLALQSGSNRCN